MYKVCIYVHQLLQILSLNQTQLMKQNPYKTLRNIGNGNFGRVDLVQSEIDGRCHVMKVIPSKTIYKLDTIQQKQTNIIKQVQIMRNLCHQYVIRYYDSFRDRENNLFIIMEYAENGELDKYLNDRKAHNNPLSQDEVLQWFIQLCLGIKYIHDQRILHRDLKCQNIFISGQNQLKIGDFGISKYMRETCDLTGTKIGTPCIMAPQIWQNKKYNQKSDIWSLGCVLYKMMTLTNAFHSNAIGGYVMKITSGSYPPITGNYSSDLKNLVKRMLSLDAHARPSVHSILQLDFIKKKTCEVLEGSLKKYSQLIQTPTLQKQKTSTSNNKLLSQKRSFSSLSNSSMLTPKNTNTFNNTKIVQMKQSYPILVEQIKTMKKNIEQQKQQKQNFIGQVKVILQKMKIGKKNQLEKVVETLFDKIQEYESAD